MNNCLYVVTLVLFAFIAGCKGYSSYSIDGKPLIKIDTGLLGIWKATEDTDKADYILIQNYYDVFHYESDSFMSAIDKNDFENKNNYYYITRMDNHGTNPHYQQFNSFLSVINGVKFINISYVVPDFPPLNGEFIDEHRFFFVRIIGLNKNYDKMTIALVADTSLRYLPTSMALRTKIMNCLNDPKFYSDTVHFYKISNYHLTWSKSRTIANSTTALPPQKK